jgi:hypothetical protein
MATAAKPFKIGRAFFSVLGWRSIPVPGLASLLTFEAETM